MTRAGLVSWTISPATLPVRRRARRPAAIFAALGDETRLGLVSRLSGGGPASISRLTTGSGVTRQAVRKHLGVLARAGLVEVSRRGRESLWRLEPARLEEAQRALELIGQQWDRALGKLKTFLESPVGDEPDAEARLPRGRAAGPRPGPDRSD
jgi:DNA-binding transcriptional ArsR family regulator